jgi:hypothetical protein
MLTFMFELFWCNIRLTTAQAFAEMRLLFPAHSENVRDTKVGNLCERKKVRHDTSYHQLWHLP